MHNTVRMCRDVCTFLCARRLLSTYLLGESTKELIQELGEDEAYILERFKGRNGESERL